MEGNIIELQPFTLIGMGLECPGYDFSGVGELWGRFNARSGELPQTGRVVGLSSGRGGGAYYIAAREVPAGTPVPDGMESAQVPGAQYFHLHFHAPPAEMRVAFTRIFRELLPGAGLKPQENGICLEEYPADWHDEAAGKFKCELYAQLA